MGCSSSRKKDLRDNEFYREAVGFRTKDLRGLKVDVDIHRTQTKKKLNTNSNTEFFEEHIDHADESGVVKPWLANIVAPDQEVEEDHDYPKYTIKLEHIFGIRVEDCRQNLFFLQKDELLYMNSSLGIIQNIDDLSQTLFGGFATKEDRECHDNDIMALAFYKGDVSMVATGQRGMQPTILVWSPLDSSVVYAKFLQPKGSKEVSALDFDKDGHYLASFGKDDLNSFYVFDMETKSLYWKQNTDNSVAMNEEQKEYLLDVAFNPTKDEICVCGINKIIFGFITRKTMKNVYIKTDETIYFTAITYTSNGSCLVGSERGDVNLFKENKLVEVISISSGSIQNLTFSDRFDKIYVSDSLNYVYILNEKDYKKLDSFEMESVVKSIDVNEDEDIAMGLKNGDIIIKHYRDPTKREVTFLKCHSEGSVGGLDFIPENRVITSGEDNKILLWNLRSKKCECMGLINELLPNPYAQKPSEVYMFQARNKSQCISYNVSKDHVAVGINDGTISIRKGMKKLNERLLLNDINVSDKPITELKYTTYGDLLIASSESGDLVLLDANVDYEIVKRMTLTSHLISLDWDINNKYIQAVTGDNKYIFINIDDFTEVDDPLKVNGVEWPRITCKFGYTVQGVYMGSTDPNFVSCVCKANSKKIILSGDDDSLLNLYNYPTVSENPKVKRFKGHSGIIKRIVFSNDDEKIVTIASQDKSVILWSLVPQ